MWSSVVRAERSGTYLLALVDGGHGEGPARVLVADAAWLLIELDGTDVELLDVVGGTDGQVVLHRDGQGVWEGGGVEGAHVAHLQTDAPDTRTGHRCTLHDPSIAAHFALRGVYPWLRSYGTVHRPVDHARCNSNGAYFGRYGLLDLYFNPLSGTRSVQVRACGATGISLAGAGGVCKRFLNHRL